MYQLPAFQNGFSEINLANDRMMENTEELRRINTPSREPMAGGYARAVSIVEYIANLNSINDFSIYLNPKDHRDYFLFERGNNIYAIPDGYINIGSLSSFDFDGDEIAAAEYLEQVLED